jgi:hypothetical protein
MNKIYRKTYEQSILTINSHGTFDPTRFLGERFTVWKGPVDGDGLSGEEDRDGRNFMIGAIAFAQVSFETCLGEGESALVGEEKLKRLRKNNILCLGGDAFLSLWLDYLDNQEESILEWLRLNRGVNYLDFFGVILRKKHDELDSIRCVLALQWDADRLVWNYDVRWLAFNWMSIFPSVILSMKNEDFLLRSSYEGEV